MGDVKKQLIAACKEYTEGRISRFNASMNELEEALKPESRSCMGDKYETSRAMLHLEFEKMAGQAEQFNNLKKTVNLIEVQAESAMVSFGSVVRTTGANYFISIPAGEIKAAGENFFAVGINSPVAQQLLGKSAGDSFVINGKSATIREIG